MRARSLPTRGAAVVGKVRGHDPARTDPRSTRWQVMGRSLPRSSARPTTGRRAFSTSSSVTAPTVVTARTFAGDNARRGDAVTLHVDGEVTGLPSGAGAAVRWRTLLMLALTSVTVAACGGGGGGGRGDSANSSILLYNGQHQELTQALVAAFEHATGISVNLRTNDGVVLADQLMQEGQCARRPTLTSPRTRRS